MTFEDWIFQTRRRIGRADYTFTTFLPSTQGSIADRTALDWRFFCFRCFGRVETGKRMKSPNVMENLFEIVKPLGSAPLGEFCRIFHRMEKRFGEVGCILDREDERVPRDLVPQGGKLLALLRKPRPDVYTVRVRVLLFPPSSSQ